MTTTLPPGPRGPKVMTFGRFVVRPVAFLEDCRRRYGDMFTLEMAEGRTVVVSADPEVAREVFKGDPNLLHAGAGNAVLKPLLGSRSVLLLDGPEHMRQRKLMLPPFHGERMRRYGELMTAVAEREIARWPQGTPFPVAPSMQAITLEVILRAVFGITDQARLEELGGALRRLLDATANPRRLVALQFTSSQDPHSLSPWGRLRARIAPADAILLDEIRTRRAGGEGDGEGAGERDDILSLLLAARDEDGEPLTDAELRDELMTLLVAGHETTATALAWAVEALVRHPRALARAQAEAQAGEHAYLDAAIRETLRLRPVLPAVIRRLEAPMTFGGRDLPAGVHIAPSIYLIHRREDIYPEPAAFRPERFLDRLPGTYEWIPFGGGVRRCLGASFALYEMRMVLGAMLRMVALDPVAGPGERVRRRAITFVPARGATVSIRRPAQPLAP